MAKKFVTTRELDLIKGWNKELIQGTSKQQIIYYGIDYENSVVDDTYDEALYKEYLSPVILNARVEFSQSATHAGGGTLDTDYLMVASCQRDELDERNLSPREGDFVEYGQIVFEITSVERDEPIFGQMNAKLQVKLTCIPSRETQFKADNVTVDQIDNTHPVEPARPRTLGDDL